MDLQVKIARTPEDFNEVFRLRYKIFGEELAYINREDYPDMLEKDDFDELDTTTNFVVMKNHETVG
ncbi:MAG: hypothetical protein GY941_26615, partial [Planctomycetes bacterium]|nr:hypothetical protein [Planctomycetota bacterium]